MVELFVVAFALALPLTVRFPAIPVVPEGNVFVPLLLRVRL